MSAGEPLVAGQRRAVIRPVWRQGCAGHGLVRNLHGGHSRLGLVARGPSDLQPPLLVRAWDELTVLLLAG